MNQFIKDNIDQLCEYTIVNENLLTKLKTLGLIADDLIGKIDRQDGDLAKALVLYTHIQTTVLESNYPQIKTALKRSVNERALQFFEQNFLNDSSGVSETTTASLPESNSSSNELATSPSSSVTSAAPSFDTEEVYEVVTDKSSGQGQCPTDKSTDFKPSYLKCTTRRLCQDCQYAGCEKTILSNYYEQHLKSTFELSETGGNGFTKCWICNVERGNLIHQTIIMEYGETFVLNFARPHMDTKFFYVWVNVLGSAETANKFEFRLMILNSDKTSDVIVSQVLPVLAFCEGNHGVIPALAIESSLLGPGSSYCRSTLNSDHSVPGRRLRLPMKALITKKNS